MRAEANAAGCPFTGNLHITRKLLTACFVLGSLSNSAAQEFELRAADLRVYGDVRWTGGGWGGYHPIRLQITNYGEGRDIELRFLPHDGDEGTASARRRLRIEQNATARLSLAVPLLGGRNSGRFEVAVDGVANEDLQEDISLLSAAQGEVPFASMLVISPEAVNLLPFEVAGWAFAPLANLPMSGAGGFVPGSGLRGASRTGVIDPSLLPTTWIDYSALDVVALRLDVFAKLRPDERAALLGWVATGGRMILSDVGDEPTEAAVLSQALEVGDRRGSTDWQPGTIADRPDLSSAFIGVPREMLRGGDVPNEGSPFPGMTNLLGGAMPDGVRQLLQGLRSTEAMAHAPANPFAAATWQPEEQPFFVRHVGLGRIAAVKGDVFSANASDWAWLLQALGGPAMIWPIRNGLASGAESSDFLEFPIPGVTGVPTTAFLTLITLFAIVIGPVNYVWLWRKGQLARLVVTVPAIAAVTSCVLFAYAAVAHGFSTKGRVRSITYLDGDSNRATTMSRLALFSGHAPSAGLRFSRETAIYPIYPIEQQFVRGDVDWTDRQTLSGGWIMSRTRTQFITLGQRDERGRLTVHESENSARILNGFEFPMRYLIVRGSNGRIYGGTDVAAGGEAKFRPLTQELWSALRELAGDSLPQLPEGVDPEEMRSLFGRARWRWNGYGWKPSQRTGLLERNLAMLMTQSPLAIRQNDSEGPDDYAEDRVPHPKAVDAAVRDDTLGLLSEPRSFLAVADGNPGIDLGGLSVDERQSFHIIVGTW